MEVEINQQQEHLERIDTRTLAHWDNVANRKAMCVMMLYGANSRALVTHMPELKGLSGAELNGRIRLLTHQSCLAELIGLYRIDYELLNKFNHAMAHLLLRCGIPECVSKDGLFQNIPSSATNKVELSNARKNFIKRNFVASQTYADICERYLKYQKL